MSGRKVAFGVYKRYIANMATKILTTDQKIDLILNKVTSLEINQKSLEKNQANMQLDMNGMKGDITSMKGDITDMKSDITSMKGDISDLVDMTTNTLELAANTADRVDKIESHLSSKTGFTPFTSGAFVA